LYITSEIGISHIANLYATLF